GVSAAAPPRPCADTNCKASPATIAARMARVLPRQFDSITIRTYCTLTNRPPKLSCPDRVTLPGFQPRDQRRRIVRDDSVHAGGYQPCPILGLVGRPGQHFESGRVRR